MNKLDKGQCGLLVVDIQGNLATTIEHSEPFLNKTKKLINVMRTLGLPVVWMEQYPHGLGQTLPQIAEELAGLTPFEKITFSGLDDKVIAATIAEQNCRHWLVCGVETHICVNQTIMSLLSLGYQASLVVDCTGSRHSLDKQIAMRRIEQEGGQLRTFEMAAYELLQRADSVEFKTLLPLFKG